MTKPIRYIKMLAGVDKPYRYWLYRQWRTRGRDACFIMLNPSTADETKDDPTMRRVVGFCEREGCRSVMVVNLFALIATEPKQLIAHDDPVGPQNDHAILQAVEDRDLVVAAWGNLGTKDRRCDAVLELLKGVCEVHALGFTKGGHPSHPLYLRGDTKLSVLQEREGVAS